MGIYKDVVVVKHIAIQHRSFGLKKLSSARIMTYRLSRLQENILLHVNERESKKMNADYSSLVNDLGKDRITVLQSIKSLVRHHFVNEKKINANQEKSKIIFHPSEKGICYSIAFLNMNVDDAIKLFGQEDELAKYREFIGGVADYQGRAEFMKNSCKLMLELNLFDEHGKSKVSDRKRLFQIGFVTALMSLTASGKFDAGDFFGKQTSESMKKVLTKSELKEFQNYLSELKDNIDIVMDGLVKNLG